MKLPRWVHRLYAGIAGYFWLPCPDCGVMFGGHEVVFPDVFISQPGSSSISRIKCPSCTRAQEARDIEQLDRWSREGYPS